MIFLSKNYLQFRDSVYFYWFQIGTRFIIRILANFGKHPCTQLFLKVSTGALVYLKWNEQEEVQKMIPATLLVTWTKEQIICISKITWHVTAAIGLILSKGQYKSSVGPEYTKKLFFLKNFIFIETFLQRIFTWIRQFQLRLIHDSGCPL